MSWKKETTSPFTPDNPFGNDDFVEETPTMRSVALGNPGRGALVSDFSGGFDRKSEIKFGIPKPSKSLQLSRESFGVKQEWSATADTSSWNVNGKELEMVPVDFPLERTHREIKEDASIVASRISDALRKLSIQTEFDSSRAKAKCKTSDCVNFRIRLYAGGENGQPVIVEVQRRCGSASSFMRSCRAILNAAEGITSTESSDTRKIPLVKKPIGQMKCLEKALVPFEETKKDLVSALDGTLEMIKSNSYDQASLGMENLCHLTDPTKTSPVASLQICKDIISGKESLCDIREEIRVLTERDSFVHEFEEGGNPTHAENMRQFALRVFSNALSLCRKDGDFLSTCVKEQRWFRENLIPSLVDEIKRAPTSSNNAYEASCCVFSLISCSDLALRAFLENGGASSLEAAHKFGVERHELLGEETLRCLEIIRSVDGKF